MSAPLAEKNTRTALVMALQRLNVYSDDEQRHVVARWTKGRARRRTELAEDEARALIAMLRTLTEAEVQAVLAAPLPPPPAVEPSPEELADVLAPLTEPQPSPAEPPACLAAWCEDDACPGEHPEQPAPAVAQVDVVPPAPVRVEPVPVDLEAAKEAAVARFRERQAAGIVLEPPALADIPPRVPVILGPAPGGYCLAICYCGECPQYQPLPPIGEVRDGGKRSAEAQRRSWDNREGGTWIDQL